MIPEHTKFALKMWVRHGHNYRPGSFLTAILSNDLFGAFNQADDSNLSNMEDIVKWMYNNLPISCYGSVKKFEEWEGISEQQYNAWSKCAI